MSAELPLDPIYKTFLSTLSATTKHTWRLPIRKYQNFLKLESITSPFLAQESHLLEYITSLRTEPKPGSTMPYKEYTVATNRTALRALYQWGMDTKQITWNPATRLSKIRLTLEYNPNPLTMDERTRLMRYIVQPKTFEDCRNSLAIALGLCQGFRIHEVCKVKITDFDFKKNRLYVFGKGKKEKFLPLDSLVEHLAKRMLKFQHDTFGHADICPVEYLLAQKWFALGKAHPRILHRSFKETIIKCKIEGHRFHDLRATFMTEIWNQGQDEFLLCDLGRCTMETAQHYVKISENKRDNIFGRISKQNSDLIKISKAN